MIPLLVTGAVSLASNVIEAWKAHAEQTALTKAINGPDFQASLKAATTQATAATAAAEKQKEVALPGDIQSVTRQILQSPDVQSIARANASSVNLEFNSNGDLFAAQPGGALRRIVVSPEVRQQLQALNGTLRQQPASAGNAGMAKVEGEAGGGRLAVQVKLTAV
jgi:hypothetical protein